MRSTLPIDVIIPAFNAAVYLNDALSSVARQSINVNKIIVIDDGSTDDTASIARSFNAIVLSTHNQGVAEARNIGIRASSASMIALLDADDRWHPDHLRALWKLHDAAPDVLLLASDYAVWDGQTTSDGSLAVHPLFSQLDRYRAMPEGDVIARFDLMRAIIRRNFILPSSMLLDRRIFSDHSEFFTPRVTLPEDESILIGEDFEWLLRVLKYTDVAFVKHVSVDYRINKFSLSARRGRIRYGDVVLGERVALHPDRYPADASRLFAELKAQMLRESAVAHLHASESNLAARRFSDYASLLPRYQALFIRLLSMLVRLPLVCQIVSWIGARRRAAWPKQRQD